MKRHILTLSALFAGFALLSACGVDTSGISPSSSRGPHPKTNISATVRVEEFGDLQCPACQGAQSKIVKPLIEKYGSQIRFEFKHFPIRSIHAFAQEAAEAAECAADQGKFWEFIEDTYESKENQQKLSRKDLIARAEKVGVVDIELFQRCAKSRIKRDAVQADYKEGLKRGVAGTPTFFVGSEKVQSNTLEALGAAIEKAGYGAAPRL